MKYYIQTYGCQMNVADSDFIASYFDNLGYEKAEEARLADIIVVNTCSVRELPEHKAASYLGRLRPIKDGNPKLKVVLAGCMAQRVGDGIKRKFPIVDLVVGAREIEYFPNFLEKILPSKAGNAGAPMSSYRPAPEKTAKPASVFTTIMRGCDNYCSYCIVPYVRGHEKSRPVAELLDEIREYVAQGAKEVTLLGQNVNSYNDAGTDFAGLLAQLNDLPGLERIRFMTNHAKDLGDRLINAIAELPKVCEHMHLPLQSGSDRILAAMNRRYTAAGYLDKVKKLKEAVPGISLTTDIMVGFPGETDQDFADTLAVMRQADFDAVFAFKYSPRPGTASAKLADDVPPAVKDARLAQVLEEGDGISGRKNAILLGTKQEILVDRKLDRQFEGRLRNNKKVYVPSTDDIVGRLVTVHLTEVHPNSFVGTVIQ